MPPFPPYPSCVDEDQNGTGLLSNFYLSDCPVINYDDWDNKKLLCFGVLYSYWSHERDTESEWE